MKLLDFIPVKLNFLLICGILFGTHLDVSLGHNSILAGLCFLLLRIIIIKPEYRHSSSFGIIAAITTLNIGVIAVDLSRPSTSKDHYSQFTIDKAIRWDLKITNELNAGYHWRYIVKVIGVNGRKASGKLLLSIPKDMRSESLSVDDEILIWAQARAFSPPLNPHQFNYSTYMSGLGVQHQIRLNSGKFYRKKVPERTITGLAAAVRNQVTDKLRNAGIRKEELGIIQALLLGERKEIDAEIYTDYKNAGAIHMLAVSGLHIGIILLFLDFILKPIELFPGGRKIKLGITVFLLWGFAILAGFSASVIRAVAMFSFVAYAIYLNRPGNSFNILALSMFFILIVFDPTLLFQPGFQMSYLAVIFIVWIYPLLQRFWSPGNKLIRRLWQLFSVSLSAQLGVLPISLFYFHQFPGLFFVSNLLVIPFLGLILGLGITLVCLTILDLLPNFLAGGYASLIKLMNTVIGWIASHDEFIIKDVSFDLVQVLLLYLAICTLILLLSKIRFRVFAFFLIAVLGLQGWSLFLLHRDISMQKTIVLHQTANSIIFHQTGRNLAVFTADSIRAKALIRNYKVAERIDQMAYYPVKNRYKIAEKRLLIVDSFAVLPEHLEPEVLLLRQSPRFNLDRYLANCSPKLIIADGSNYLNYINRWKKTCKRRKIPFHYTGEKGAYYFTAGY
ncbi:MAG: ComEC family competence protein [Eudoraea sp.]|nr:ComEC family competence protein [Eudoraea sp.]